MGQVPHDRKFARALGNADEEQQRGKADVDPGSVRHDVVDRSSSDDLKSGELHKSLTESPKFAPAMEFF